MELDPIMKFRIILDSKELSLMTKALRREMENKEEFEKALAMSDDLTMRKIKVIAQMADESEKLKKNYELAKLKRDET